MGLMKWCESRIKNLTMWDFAILKIYLFLLGAVVGAYLAAFVKQYVWAILTIVLIAIIWLMYKIFKK